MENKTFNTRVKNKRDTAANWEAVATTFQPLDGELIIVDTAAGKTRFKVGRYDTAKGRLLYYNEIPFTDEYLYNDLNESQGKIYDKLNGIDDKSIIEMTLEPSEGNGTIWVYHIGLWQFPKTGLYKIHLTQHGTTSDLFKVFARKTKDDGTLPEDFTQDNLVIQHLAMGDTQVNDLYIQVDYIDNDKFTVYNVRFLTLLQPYNAQVNVYDKTTQKWQFVSATYVQSAKSADRLAHQLTLTKGDTTTKFDGSTAQTVEIPTKTSELTNDSFVSYAEQTLTEGQQNQAKTNLGIDVLTGNTTAITPTQVKEAILAGRSVAITYTDTIYGNLTFTSFGYSVENNAVVANLVAILYGKYILADLTGNSNNSSWTLQTTELGTSTDIANNYVKYSETQTLTDEQKATARFNIGANFEPFKVTLSRTYGKPYLDKTPKEIYDAYTAGKYVYLEERNNSLLPLTSAKGNNGKYTISFSGTSKVSENYNIQVISFSVINVTSDYSGQWTEDYKYNIDAKVFKLNYNPSTNEVSGSNPCNSIAMLNNSGQTAVIQLNNTNANNKLYLNQVLTNGNNAFMFQAFVGDEMLILIIASDFMQIQGLYIITKDNIKHVVDQSYVAFYTEQALSDKEKKQARDNIGAVSSSDLVQSDWNQNDETAKDYIKNKSLEVPYWEEFGTWTTTYSSFEDDHYLSINAANAILCLEVNNTRFENLTYTSGSYGSFTLGDIDTIGVKISNSGMGSSTNSLTVSETMFPDGVTSAHIYRKSLKKLPMDALPNEIDWVKTIDGDSIVTTSNRQYVLSNSYLGAITISADNASPKFDGTVRSAMLYKQPSSYAMPPSVSLNGFTGTSTLTLEHPDYKDTYVTADEMPYGSTLVGTDSGGKPVLLNPRRPIATSITSSSTNRQYAGAKAVYDYVNDKIPNNSNIVNGKTTGSLVMINASDSDIMLSPGKNSFSGGEGTLASGSASHTEGYYTSAQGNYSHAEGSNSIASGEAAHAEGGGSVAVGKNSHAEGTNCRASGEASHAEGKGTDANSGQHVQGKYNVEDRLGKYAHIVGNGTNTNTQSNAHTLDWSGNAWFAGDVYVGSTSGTNKDDGSKKLATEEYVDGQMTTVATIAMLQSLLPKVTTITLTSNWVGDASPYYQDIALSCVTETSIVDLQPTPEQLNSWQDDGIAFTTLSGNGTVRVYVAGGKPSSAISVQVRVQEVTVI